MVKGSAAPCDNKRSRLRGIVARRRYAALRAATAGHRLRSARVILRAWLRFRAQQRYTGIKEAWEVERSAKLLTQWSLLRDEVREEMADIRRDQKVLTSSRKWHKARLKQLLDFRIDAELRLPVKGNRRPLFLSLFF